MKRSNRLILLIGVFLAIVAFVGIVVIFQGGSSGAGAQQAAPAQLPTVFATRDISLGTPVAKEMLETKDQPITQRDASAFGSDTLVVGQIARKDIVAGKQLTAEDFDVTGAPLTIDTPGGQRAMAVNVDQISGVGTLIRTGDYVDMVAGFDLNVITVDPETGSVVAGAPEVKQSSTKVMLQGMQVLGTLLPPPTAPAESGAGTEGGAATEGGTALNDQREIVILSVNAQQAEVIKLAQMSGAGGSITLVLRSPSDFRDPTTQEPIEAPVAETTGITLKSLVEDYGLLVPDILEPQLPAQP